MIVHVLDSFVDLFLHINFLSLLLNIVIHKNKKVKIFFLVHFVCLTKNTLMISSKKKNELQKNG